MKRSVRSVEAELVGVRVVREGDVIASIRIRGTNAVLDVPFERRDLGSLAEAIGQDVKLRVEIGS